MAGGQSPVDRLVLAIEAAGFPEATAAVDELRGAVGGLTEAVGALNTEMAAGTAGAGAAAARGGSKRGLMASLTSMKAMLGGLGIYEAIKHFSDFEASTLRYKTQAGATTEEVDRMRKGILAMSKEVGTAPLALAESMYHIQSVGIRGQAALDAMRVAAEGAKIGIANVTDTTNAMTAVSVAGFKGVNTLSQAMGQLNATVGAGDMTFQNLNEALATGFLATMKASGLQIKDVGAALAVLGDNNIRGAEAATKLRMSITMLAKESGPARETMKALGLGPLQLAEDLHKPNGLLAMLKDLEDHFAKVGLGPGQGAHIETVRAHDIFEIFGGGRNALALTTLLEQMTRLEEKYKRVGEGGKNFSKDWEEATHNLQFFIDEIKSLIDVWLVRLGSALNEVVRWFEKNKQAVEVLKYAIGSLIAALAIEKIVMFGRALIGLDAAAATAAGGIGSATVLGRFRSVGGLLGAALMGGLMAYVALHSKGSPLEKLIHAIMPISAGAGDEPSFHPHTPKPPTGVFAPGQQMLWDAEHHRWASRAQREAEGFTFPNWARPTTPVREPGSVPMHSFPSALSPSSPLPSMQPLEVNLYLDGKRVSKAVIRQGLIAQSRAGHAH